MGSSIIKICKNCYCVADQKKNSSNHVDPIFFFFTILGKNPNYKQDWKRAFSLKGCAINDKSHSLILGALIWQFDHLMKISDNIYYVLVHIWF